MKRILFFGLFVICKCAAFGEPITVQLYGHFNNCKERTIYFRGEGFNDSVHLDESGDFVYKSVKLKHPLQVNVSVGTSLQFALFLAPGFSMKLFADIENLDSFYTSIKLTGQGSKINGFWKQDYLLSKSYKFKPLTDAWYEIKPENFLLEGLESLRLDSFHLVLKQTLFKDSKLEPFEKNFQSLIDANVYYRKIFFLFAYAYMNESSLGYIDTCINKAINPLLLSGFRRDDYASEFYYREIASFYYPAFLADKQIVYDKTILVNRLKCILDIACTLCSGKTEDFVLYRRISREIGETFSNEQLETLKHYIPKISQLSLKDDLTKQYSYRKTVLKDVSLGESAPDFDLKDQTGRLHGLKDFEGKVVYLDLWASWCLPCQEEMPLLKEINDYYSPSNKLQTISIAVQDIAGGAKRQAFIDKFNLNWLQLEDNQNFVWKKYKITSIPRFILIDKNGKILSFDAPRPSDKDKLKILIDKAISD